VDFAHAVIEAHFEAGCDLNDPRPIRRSAARPGLSWPAPDLADPGRAAAAWAEGRAMGVSSFPTLAVLSPRGAEVLPSTYDPDALLALVDAARPGRREPRARS
jgi:hypothetical protein